jgi:hypothetical protein
MPPAAPFRFSNKPERRLDLDLSRYRNTGCLGLIAAIIRNSATRQNADRFAKLLVCLLDRCRLSAGHILNQSIDVSRLEGLHALFVKQRHDVPIDAPAIDIKRACLFRPISFAEDESFICCSRIAVARLLGLPSARISRRSRRSGVPLRRQGLSLSGIPVPTFA